MHWLAKFWFVFVLIPFWAAVASVLLDRLRGDSKLHRGMSPRNQAHDRKKR